MAFPVGWTGRQKVTIDATKVTGSANLTDFPMLITDSNIPDAVYAAMLSTGADIRFTSDLAGTTELAFEIVAIDTTAKTAEIWVKVPTLKYDTDTLIYMWYGKADATAYAVTDTYGARAAWKSAYTSVHHLKDATTSTVTDTTGTFNGTKSSANNPIEGTGKIGKGQTFTGDLINIGDGAGLDFGTGEFAVFAWANHNSIAAGTTYSLAGKLENGANYDGLLIKVDTSGYADLAWRSGAVAYEAIGATDLTDGVWHRWAAVRRSTGIYIYIDGVQVGSNTNANTQNNEDNADAFCIGSERSGTTASGWPGLIDEVFVWKGTAPTADWILTEYNNQSAPTTFLAITAEPLIELSTVTTSTPAGSIDSNSATGGGNVTDAGGGTVSERGIAWGTSINPTIAGTHQASGTGTGAFGPVNMTSLATNTYYYRAYATNEAGTAYGANVEFDTLNAVISGVCSLAGSPVLGAIVTLIDSATDTVVATDTSDASGIYSFGGLDVTKIYHVTAEYEDSPDQYNTKSLPFMTPEEV